MNLPLHLDQTPAASLHFHNGASRAGDGIREALERAGVRVLAPSGPGDSAPFIICFSEFDDSLVAVVRERTRAGAGLALAVAVAGAVIRPAESWRLLHAGAADVVAWDGGESAAEQIRARLERWAELDQLCDLPEVRETLVGNSPAWRRLVRQIVEAARFTRTPILLMGESGTGKELLARVVHAMASGGSRALVTVDCTTIVPELAGSELFGHEKGAFTGSVGAREGAFALAHGGTLFLDEAGELPPALQAQLLRVIQEGTYKRVGGNVWQTTEFRLVCATNRDLKEQVARGDFRLDLYYRIAGWVFHTIPLRDRREDILPLAHHFLAAFQNGSGASELDPAVRHYLVTREYPGNIRDLRQLLQRIAQRHVGAGPVTPGDIPEEDRPRDGAVAASWEGRQLDQAVAQAIAMGAGLRDIAQATTESAIRMAVQSEKGNLQKAAKRLGVTDRALQMRKASGRF